jgi:hypothetical protein
MGGCFRGSGGVIWRRSIRRLWRVPSAGGGWQVGEVVGVSETVLQRRDGGAAGCG